MKLVIIGYSGAGKTTLAKSLGEALHIKVFHIDSALYDKNGGRREAAEVMSIAESCIDTAQETSWIIDGYERNCVKETWLADAEQIVFLRVGKWTCFWRVFLRDAKQVVPWAIKCASRYFRHAPSVQQTANQERETSTVKPPSFISRISAKCWQLRDIITKTHGPEGEAYYMRFGQRYPEKFIVLRTKKEIHQFKNALLREAQKERP